MDQGIKESEVGKKIIKLNIKSPKDLLYILVIVIVIIGGGLFIINQFLMYIFHLQEADNPCMLCCKKYDGYVCPSLKGNLDVTQLNFSKYNANLKTTTT
jgi:hypothetical protein